MMIGCPINSVISALTIIGQTGATQSGANGGESTLPAEVGVNVPFNLIIAAIAAIALALIIRFRWYRLPGFPARAAIFSPPAALGLALLMFLLPSIGLLLASRAWGISLESVDGGPPDHSLSELAQLALGGYAIQLVIVLMYIFKLVADHQKKADARSSHPLITLLLGGGMLILVWPIMNTIGWLGMLVARWMTGEPPDPIAHTTLQTLTAEPAGLWWWLMVGMVVIAAPVTEELLYRGLIQDALARLHLGIWPAIIATSALFAAMHWENTAPHAVIALFVLSLGFGLVYEKTGRLTAPIIMHMLFNVGNLVAAVLWY